MKKTGIIFVFIFFMINSIIADSNLQKIRGTEFNKIPLDQYEEFLANGCSLACAIGWEFEATSTLKAQKGNSYNPENLGDNLLKTAWVEGSKGQGIGEKIIINMKLTKEMKNIPFRGIEFVNGYAKNRKIWSMNSRVKVLKLYQNNQPKFLIELLDIKEPQEVSFKPIMINFGDKIILEIKEVYHGSKYEDTAISEINLHGAH